MVSGEKRELSCRAGCSLCLCLPAMIADMKSRRRPTHCDAKSWLKKQRVLAATSVRDCLSKRFVAPNARIVERPLSVSENWVKIGERDVASRRWRSRVAEHEM